MILEMPKQDMGDTLRLKFSNVILLVVVLPAFGMFACLCTSMMLHWEQTTASHCGVVNYLPSLSSSTGQQPEKFIWQLSIALHCSPRIFLISPLIYYYFLSGISASKWVSTFVALLHLFENLCLIGLTLVSSTENYPFHRNSFIGFLALSGIYMIIVCYLFWEHNSTFPMQKNLTSFKLKMRALIFYIICFVCAMYFFARHNWYCEPGVYSIFCFFEYCIILTNIFFHGTFAWDMKNVSLTVTPFSMSSNTDGKIT